MMRTFYKVLQVRPDADPEVIAAAYKALSKRYHPDVNKAAGSTNVMKEINSAYKILNDPVARAKYDRTLSTQQDTTSSAQTAPTKRSEGPTDAVPANGRAQKKTSDPEVRVLNSDGRFIAYDNGTVLDMRTNLMWAAKDNGSDINWANAKSYCENYRGGGYMDWRMPMLDELSGLYETKTYKKFLLYFHEALLTNTKGVIFDWLHFSGLIHLTSPDQWASEKRDSEAACFGFKYGFRPLRRQSYSYGMRALPVRSVK
jgi:hypothetical protein